MTASNEFSGNYIARTSIWMYLKFAPLSLYNSLIALIEVCEISTLVIFQYPSSNISQLNPTIINKELTRIARPYIEDTRFYRDMLPYQLAEGEVPLVPVKHPLISEVPLLPIFCSSVLTHHLSLYFYNKSYIIVNKITNKAMQTIEIPSLKKQRIAFKQAKSKYLPSNTKTATTNTSYNQPPKTQQQFTPFKPSNNQTTYHYEPQFNNAKIISTTSSKVIDRNPFSIQSSYVQEEMSPCRRIKHQGQEEYRGGKGEYRGGKEEYRGGKGEYRGGQQKEREEKEEKVVFMNYIDEKLIALETYFGEIIQEKDIQINSLKKELQNKAINIHKNQDLRQLPRQRGKSYDPRLKTQSNFKPPNPYNYDSQPTQQNFRQKTYNYDIQQHYSSSNPPSSDFPTRTTRTTQNQFNQNIRKQVEELSYMITQLQEGSTNCQNCYTLKIENQNLQVRCDFMQTQIEKLKKTQKRQQVDYLDQIENRICENQRVRRENTEMKHVMNSKYYCVSRAKPERDRKIKESVAKRCRTLTDYNY